MTHPCIECGSPADECRCPPLGYNVVEFPSNPVRSILRGLRQALRGEGRVTVVNAPAHDKES